MKNTFIAKAIATTGLLFLLTGGYLMIGPKKKADICLSHQLQKSQIEINTKDKQLLSLHMDYSYSKKVKKYLPHVKSLKSEVFYKKGQKQKPSLISVTTEFKSKKKAKSAYTYLKKKWKMAKKGQHDVALKENQVIWYSNSHYQPQCFFEVVAASKSKMGVFEGPDAKTKPTKIAVKKKSSQKTTKKRKVASHKKRKKLKNSKRKRKRRLASRRK